MKETPDYLSTLPLDLRLRIMAMLPPNVRALGARLACKAPARTLSDPQHRTARISQPLPGYVVGRNRWPDAGAGQQSAAAAAALLQASQALPQLALWQKLQLLTTAAASGCEANVELVWQLLQPCVFPELLQSGFYRVLLQKHHPQWQEPCLGAAVVASGLAHLLPSLEQRCPGLLDPTRTLEATSKHCDLAGLQAVWEAVGKWFLEGNKDEERGPYWKPRGDWLKEAWQCIMAAAARSPTADALAKMAWVVETGRPHSPVRLLQADVWGAAAASGDMARLSWLRDRGFLWDTGMSIEAVFKHASMNTIQRMEECGDLPSTDAEAFMLADRGAGASPCYSAAKLRWLAGRGVPIGRRFALEAAAGAGNLEALQVLYEHWRAYEGTAAALPEEAVRAAVRSGNVPTIAWLVHEGGAMDPCFFQEAFSRGSVPAVRWLLEAGWLRPEGWAVSDAVDTWPCRTAAGRAGLVEAARLLAASGVPVRRKDPLYSAASRGLPWSMWCALQELMPEEERQEALFGSAHLAARAGCEATLEALVGQGVLGLHQGDLASAWYATAAANGDRAMLNYLRRLGLSPEWQAAFRHVPLPAQQWLAEHGAALGPPDEAQQWAAGGGALGPEEDDEGLPE